MTECPFLSTYDNSIECFKECALYNYKATGDSCPFQNLNEYMMGKVDYKHELESTQKDFIFARESYKEMQNQYL
ncbi:hypothetical protein HBE96_10640 [Clostridium sp. P21]|uniref:Uncharacterized protein n=2 Tax=Clostridium muellerianum TaxID=2716538 RepID=A0A7Y0EIR8_9CLOT|nr:hypothetical protein [Clostridium muellerianum]